MITRRTGLVRAACFAVLAVAAASCAAGERPKTAVAQPAKRLPNIVIFYADDLGYGDLGSYGARGLSTPNVDRLAREGVRFTDAHATAATCTPSRYSLLTGEYGFRSQAEILPGDAPALIRPDKFTLADMLKGQGYTTGVVGKWHLGLGEGKVDWNSDVKPGPLEIGFDYSFLLPSTMDRVPTVYLENYRVVGLDPSDPLSVSYAGKIGDRPTGTEHPEQLRFKADRQHSDSIINGVSRIGYMKGGKAAEWVDEELYEVVTGKAVDFIRTNREKPFFLFMPLHDPHVPRLARWRGCRANGCAAGVADGYLQHDGFGVELRRSIGGAGCCAQVQRDNTRGRCKPAGDGARNRASDCRLGARGQTAVALPDPRGIRERDQGACRNRRIDQFGVAPSGTGRTGGRTADARRFRPTGR